MRFAKMNQQCWTKPTRLPAHPYAFHLGFMLPSPETLSLLTGDELQRFNDLKMRSRFSIGRENLRRF